MEWILLVAFIAILIFAYQMKQKLSPKNRFIVTLVGAALLTILIVTDTSQPFGYAKFFLIALMIYSVLRAYMVMKKETISE